MMPLAMAVVLLGASPTAFELGLARYNAGDKEGALQAFERARAEDPKPGVLFNIALVADALGRTVYALETVELVLAAPGALPPARLARARGLQEALRRRVGTLVIRSPIEGVAVDVDGRQVGRTPLPVPVRVPAGRVLITAMAPRFAPHRDEVKVAPGETKDVALVLEPLERPLAQLRVQCEVPGADVFIDGERVAITPVEATIPVIAGVHQLRLSRVGYRSAERPVSLGEGATGEVQVTLEEDSSAVAQSGVRLEPRFSETQVQVWVDGQRRGVDPLALVLPPGPHVLRFERAGFFAQQRALTFEPGAPRGLEVLFEPTPELRATLEDQQHLHQRLGLGGLAAGGALLVAGSFATAFNVSGGAAAQEALNEATRHEQFDFACATSSGRMTCEIATANARASVEAFQRARWVGPTMLGVGAAAAVAGLVAWLTAPSPTAWDRAPPASELEPSVSAVVGPGGVGVQVSGTF